MTTLLLLARYWRESIIAALVATLAIVLALHAASSHRKDARIVGLTDQVAVANAKLAVSNASIDTLTDALNAKNAESDARAASYAATRAGDGQDVAREDKAQAADQPRRDTLAAIAKAADRPGGCSVPPALLASLGGL